MMFNELVKTVKVQLYERVSSPLFSTFIISWFLWNYRFIMVLLDKSKIENKFVVIDSILYPAWYSSLLWNIILPATTAYAMIYIYPIPAKKVFEHWKKQQLELKEIQQNIEDITPLTLEEGRVIRQEALKLELEFFSQLKKKDEEINDLKNIIVNFSESGSYAKKNNNNFGDTISEIEDYGSKNQIVDSEFDQNYEDHLEPDKEDLIDGVAKPEGDFASLLGGLLFNSANQYGDDGIRLLYLIATEPSLGEESLQVITKIEPVMHKHLLDTLISDKLIDSSWDSNTRKYLYKVTSEGRKIILKSKYYQREIASRPNSDVFEDSKIKLSPDEEFETAFSIALWNEEITERIMKLASGDKITFKELVPQVEWYHVPDVKRKMMGKEFKQMVDRGDFVGLVGLPEKTSSNEQLYAKE